MRWLAALLVSALFAGCVEPGPDASDHATDRVEDEPAVLPEVSVQITDQNGIPTHRISSAEGNSFIFTPTLVSGNLSHLDWLGIGVLSTGHGLYSLEHPLLREGELVPTQWAVQPFEDGQCHPDEDGRYSTGGSAGSVTVYLDRYNHTLGYEDRNAAPPLARLAFDPTYARCTYEFGVDQLTTEPRACSNSRIGYQAIEWYHLHLESIPPWAINDTPVDDPRVRVVVDMDGDADLILCQGQGDQEAERMGGDFVQRADGRWELALDESTLTGERGFVSSRIHIFNNIPGQTVTIQATVHYPATTPD